VASTRHRKHPVLIAELREGSHGYWHEASRGFLLPRRRRVAAQGTEAEAMEAVEKCEAAVDEGPSVTWLQLQIERLLRAGEGFDRWWREVDRLTDVAERTERHSIEAQRFCAATPWCPPPLAWPLVVEAGARGLGVAYEERRSTAGGDEIALADLRQALLAWLAAAPSLTEFVVLAIAGIQGNAQQRMLGHGILDAAKRIMQKRGGDCGGSTLAVDTQGTWAALWREALIPDGQICPKLVAKACQTLQLTPPPGLGCEE